MNTERWGIAKTKRLHCSKNLRAKTGIEVRNSIWDSQFTFHRFLMSVCIFFLSLTPSLTFHSVWPKVDKKTRIFFQQKKAQLVFRVFYLYFGLLRFFVYFLNCTWNTDYHSAIWQHFSVMCHEILIFDIFMAKFCVCKTAKIH